MNAMTATPSPPTTASFSAPGDLRSAVGETRVFAATAVTPRPAESDAFDGDTDADAAGENGEFNDRRRSEGRAAGRERRQFGSSHAELSPAGRELARAIDQYKVDHHRRYLTCDELLGVLLDLGYVREERGG